MSKRLSKLILPVVILSSALTPITFATLPSYAAEPTTKVCELNVPNSVKEANGCNPKANKEGLPDVVITIINAVIGVLGLVAVVFIIIGGINYMTSTGEAAKIEKAKKTILYAVIGLGICVLSFAIVNFAVGIINSQPES